MGYKLTETVAAGRGIIKCSPRDSGEHFIGTWMD